MAVVCVQDHGCGIDEEGQKETASYRYALQYLRYKQ